MKKAFRNRIKSTITKCVEVRLLVIEKGRSKNSITWDQCKQVIHEIELLQSDRQLINYLLEKQGLLRSMVPGPNQKMQKKLDQLILEATTYKTTKL